MNSVAPSEKDSTTPAHVERRNDTFGKALSAASPRTWTYQWLGNCLIAAMMLLRLSAHGEGVTAAWVQRYSNDEARSSDQAKKVVTDANGDFIVAGTSDNASTGPDMLLIKYSGSGTPLWTNRYNGPGNLNDYVSDLAVDSTGNVILIGYSISSIGSSQYVTIKYSGAGFPLWTNSYRGPGNSDAQANAGAVDMNGNVFVTGVSIGNPGNYDYATIKYSSAGLPLWTNRFNGPDNGYDQANSVAVDSTGNAFVTGFSDIGAGNYAFTTLKYSGAGVAIWTNRYNHPAQFFDDEAVSVKVDGGGNVFVTGTGGATIKYSNSGALQWLNRGGVPQPTAMALDANGNVFLTGYLFAGAPHYDYDFATVAYSSAGSPLWTNRFDGIGQADDYAYGLAVDAAGNVFVTGLAGGIDSSFDIVTIKYAIDGSPIWTNRFDGPKHNDDRTFSAAVDGLGNVVVTGYSVGIGTDYDFATIKYSSVGVAMWTNRYDGPGNAADDATAVTVDTSGNVIVTGYSFSAENNYDYLTIKYSGAGIPLWTNRFNGSDSFYDFASGVATDANGNVFVTGYSSFFGSDFEIATVAYSSAGIGLWTNLFRVPDALQSFASAIAVDSGGNVIVTGSATIKYSGVGVPLWTNYNNGVNASALALDASDTVFITGSGYMTLAYSSDGAALWTNSFDGGQASGLALDGTGNVIATGYYINDSGNYDYATVKYLGDGTPVWTNRYDGPALNQDQAMAVAADSSGNAFVTGFSTGTGGDYDYATIAYSGSGVPLWTNRYNGTGNSQDQAMAIKTDTSGNVFVSGGSIGTGGNYDYLTIKYSGSGLTLWTNRYNGPANGEDQPQSKASLAIGPDGTAYVTGWSDGSMTGARTYDYVTIKYVTQPVIAFQLPQTSPSVSDLILYGAPGSTWSVQRAIQVTGTWTNLGSLQIAPGGTGLFQDINRPVAGAFYRAAQP